MDKSNPTPTFTLTAEEVEIVRKALANTKSLFSISQLEALEDLRNRIKQWQDEQDENNCIE